MVTCIKCKEEVPAWWHIAGLCLGCRESDDYAPLECAECEHEISADNATVVNGIRIMCRSCWAKTSKPMKKPRFVLNNNLGWDMTMFLTPRGTILCPRCRREWDIRAPLDNKSVEIASPYCPQCVNFLLSASSYGKGLSQSKRKSPDYQNSKGDQEFIPSEFLQPQEPTIPKGKGYYFASSKDDPNDDLKKMWGDTEAPFK